ncbi:hypothetical protein U8527_06670 [Kordia algicida OT-1]|uniref:Uncharacterized protein n=1 Tax=Kordia algicida OT-1 TaxID=391587 RepID=A9CU54_9FLAO|nr:hypothetical protein [Kordia algicida]EDP94130.1 hypothetical protein KAOT1_00080 [Kordia algicida OT-1]
MSASKGWKLKQDSETKLIVWFADGNVRTLYSIDWNYKFSQTKKREIGLARFYKKIEDYGAKVKVAEIYEMSSGIRIAKFISGVEVAINQQENQ